VVSINNKTKEINCKIVYYGPGLGGKTTNLQVIHKKIPKTNKSEMVSLATESDRTLFFDYLPLDLGKIKGFETKFQLYTVPGQVYYNETRKLVLRGVDGVVFVADSQRSKLKETLESYENLKNNLKDSGLDLKNIPHVIQYNKRDAEDIVALDELEEKVNQYKSPFYEAIAIQSSGVFATLKSISKAVINQYNSNSSSQDMNSKFQKKSDMVSDPKPMPSQTVTKPEAPLYPSEPLEVDENIQKYIKSRKQPLGVPSKVDEHLQKKVTEESPKGPEIPLKDERKIEPNHDSKTEFKKIDSQAPPKKSLRDQFLEEDGKDDFDYTPENPGYSGLSDDLSEENAPFLDIKPYTGFNEGDLSKPKDTKSNSDLDFDPFNESS